MFSCVLVTCWRLRVLEVGCWILFGCYVMGLLCVRVFGCLIW